MAEISTLKVSLMTLLGVDHAKMILYLYEKNRNEAFKYNHPRRTFDPGYYSWNTQSF